MNPDPIKNKLSELITQKAEEKKDSSTLVSTRFTIAEVDKDGRRVQSFRVTQKPRKQ